MAQERLVVVDGLDNDADLRGRDAVARQHALDLGRQLRRMRGKRRRTDQRNSYRSHGGGFCLNGTRSDQQRITPLAIEPPVGCARMAAEVPRLETKPKEP